MKRLLLTIFFLLCAGQVWAGTYFTTQASAGTQTEDAELKESTPDTKQGTATTMRVYSGFSGNQNIWLDCPSARDTANIPAGVTIDSVFVELIITGTSPSELKVDFYYCSQAVVENDVTWNKYDATSSWVTGGGDGASVQLVALRIKPIGAGDSTEYTTLVDGSSRTDTVATLLTNPISVRVPLAIADSIVNGNNNGFLMKPNSGSSFTGYTFGSSENGTLTSRPVWKWYYTGASGATYKTNQANAATLIDDAELQQGSPTLNIGQSGTAVLAENPDTKTRSFIIRGNNVMDSIGADSTINSCFVDIVCANNGTMDFAGDTAWYDLYGLTQDWVEDSVSFDSARTDVVWTTPGGTKTLIQSGYLKLRAYDAGVNWESTIDTGSGAATIMDSGLFIGGVMRLILPHALSQGMYDSTYTGLLLWPDTASMSPAEGITINTSNASTLTNRPTMEWWATTAPAASLLPRRRRILTNE